MTVPDAPGLGVTLDKAAVARCHQRFLDDGPIDLFGGRSDARYYRLPRY